MDPFLTVIPDDRGQEIRELVRERDGFDSEGKDNELDLTRRPTANTVALYRLQAMDRRVNRRLNKRSKALLCQNTTLMSTIVSV